MGIACLVWLTGGSGFFLKRVYIGYAITDETRNSLNGTSAERARPIF